MKKIFGLLLLISFISCGRGADEGSVSELFAAPAPCGTDNGIPIVCRTERVRDYTVGVDNMLRYTECAHLRTWKSFDPYVEGLCGGVNAGKFAVFGPFLKMPASGWINAKIHILPGTLLGGWQFNFTPGTEIFAVDIYSATLGVLQRDIYHYSNFALTGNFGSTEIHEFAGNNSSLAVGKNLPSGWKEITVSAFVPSAINDLEIRVQNLHPDSNINLLGMDITYTRQE